MAIHFWNNALCFCVVLVVCSVYCTSSKPDKSSSNKEDFGLWYPILIKLFFFFLNIEVISGSNINRVYMFLNNDLAFFLYFHIKSSKKYTFSFQPFTSNFADSTSIIGKSTICWVIFFFKFIKVCIYLDIHDKNALQNGFIGV